MRNHENDIKLLATIITAQAEEILELKRTVARMNEPAKKELTKDDFNWTWAEDTKDNG